MKPFRLLLVTLLVSGAVFAGAYPIVRAIEEAGSPAAAIRAEREQLLRQRQALPAGSIQEKQQPADSAPAQPPAISDAAAAKRQFAERRQQRLRDLDGQDALKDAKRTCESITDPTDRGHCLRDAHKAALTKRQAQLRQAQLACLQQNKKAMAALVSCTLEALQTTAQ